MNSEGASQDRSHNHRQVCPALQLARQLPQWQSLNRLHSQKIGFPVRQNSRRSPQRKKVARDIPLMRQKKLLPVETPPLS